MANKKKCIICGKEEEVPEGFKIHRCFGKDVGHSFVADPKDPVHWNQKKEANKDQNKDK